MVGIAKIYSAILFIAQTRKSSETNLQFLWIKNPTVEISTS